MKHFQIGASVRELHDLLEMTAGALQCVAQQLPHGEDHTVSFAGEWQRFGTTALRDILDQVDHALALGQLAEGPVRASALAPSYYKYLKLLELSPFERRAGGVGWRFGTRRIAESVVDRLIASGRARIEGEQVISCRSEVP